MGNNRGLAAGAVAAALILASGATPAVAEGDGACNDGDACLYYNSNAKGARFDHRYNVANYSGYRFMPSPDGSSGAWTAVKNNAASVWNNDPTHILRIYYGSNYQGPVQEIGPKSTANLDPALKNNNASGSWTAQ
ncbi:peptidase inhibitor family I36 protein [Embleya sp. NPDC050154]|uniref:peptidase inhibitor family I36 protein n=1 Tax=unclassified Embleya TaxID=2699296 RepID=UPI0037AAFF7E|nr:peptidase inhibitor family I36 protein [Embleya sp. NBC_00888]